MALNLKGGSRVEIGLESSLEGTLTTSHFFGEVTQSKSFYDPFLKPNQFIMELDPRV